MYTSIYTSNRLATIIMSLAPVTKNELHYSPKSLLKARCFNKIRTTQTLPFP